MGGARYVCLLWIHLLVLGCIWLLPVLTAEAATTWNATDWTAYDTITIDSSQVDETLTNFPVYVDLSDLSTNFWSTTPSGSNAGTDIRVTTDDGSPVELPRELVSADNTGDTGELHFRADSISSSVDTVFRVYYNGTTTGDYATTSTYGAQNVWTNGFEGVYHNGASADSSSNNITGTLNGSLSAGGATGQLGVASDYNGSSQYVDFDEPSEWDFTGTAFSICAWVEIDALVNFEPIVSKGDTQYVLKYQEITNVEFKVGGAADFTIASQPNSGWHYLCGTTDGSDFSIYVDSVFNNTGNTGTFTGSTDDVWFGRNSAETSRYLDGRIDEVRISSVERSAGWLAAEFTNQSTTTDFYTAALGSVGGGSSGGGGNWYDSNYQYCREFTIGAGYNSGGAATTSSTGFTLAATGTISSFAATSSGGRIYETQTSNGVLHPVDFVVTDGTECNADGGSTVLDFYFEDYNSATGEFAMWVQAPSISSTSATDLTVYYGYADNSATLQADRTGTWDAQDELHVYNFNEGDSTATDFYKDATGSRDGTLTDSNGDSTNVSGIIGDALDFGGADYVTLSGGSFTGSSPATIMMWINLDNPTSNQRIFGSADNFEVRSNFQFGNDLFSTAGDTLDNFSHSANTWYHVVFTANRTSNDKAIYVDGDFQAGNTSGDDDATAGTATIGARSGSDPIDGTLDDFRIYNQEMTAADIQTVYNNTVDSATFWSYGAEETEEAFVAPRRLRLFEGMRLKIQGGQRLLID